jgi:hypothetical protein
MKLQETGYVSNFRVGDASEPLGISRRRSSTFATLPLSLCRVCAGTMLPSGYDGHQFVANLLGAPITSQKQRWCLIANLERVVRTLHGHAFD